MLQNTRQSILEYLQKNANVTPRQLFLEFGLSRVMLHRHLKALVESKQIIKQGIPPKVYYSVIKEEKPLPEIDLKAEVPKVLKF